MYKKPDPPMTITETLAARTLTAIGFSWVQGSQNGGTPVIDYRIYYDKGANNYTILVSSYMSTSFTIDSLTPGNTYKFKILSRNSFGLSDFSNEFSILCATVPDIPLAPTTTQVGSDIKVSWDLPSANGSPITGYLVYL
jgi:Fibronectin type III domain